MKGSHTPYVWSSVMSDSASQQRPLSPLRRAQRVGEAAAKCGFDWDHPSGPLAKIGEELEELKSEIDGGPPDRGRLREELGDLLFSVVNLARHLDVDAARALEEGIDKFERRFQRVEELAGGSLDSLTIDELEVLWQSSKDEEN